MKRALIPTLLILLQGLYPLASEEGGRATLPEPAKPAGRAYQTRLLAGWTVHVSSELLATNPAATARTLQLLAAQLEHIVRVVPAAPRADLQKVPLWISPEYAGIPPRAEYHPDASWLREHGRDPAMAKAVEFTNVRIFEPETRRMPAFALHELAHAYHDRVLGFDEPRLKAAYQEAKAGGKYDRVSRRDSEGRVSTGRAYALTDHKEFFAEMTEAFFATNDFFPFNRAELEQYDPAICRLLEDLWQTRQPGGNADPSAYLLVPKPLWVAVSSGTFDLNQTTRLVAKPGAETEANNLAATLRLPTGFALPVETGPAGANGIVLELDRALEPELGGEGYQLAAKPDRILIRAAGAAGLFYGGVTLRQLLPPEACGTNRLSQALPDGWRIPAVEIKDAPRFRWRGLLVDPARHFLPVPSLKRLLDAMALHKLNTLQLHLTDDQGWRLEVKKYPRLTQVGSLRKESPRPRDRNRGDGTPYGPFFYTQEQMRDLVAYAGARHVTVLPEIEMPGHFLAALAAYPELSCTGGPFEVRTRWGVEKDILCPGRDEAVAFAQDVLHEVLAVFPSRFIHIGGDEAPRDRWKTCPRCQARLKAEGLQSEAQLQTWFNHRIEQFLLSKGRRMIGWDEILEGGLTPGAAVMSWRGMEGGLAAAESGHDVVMSPTSHCYFDYAQAQGPDEPESIGGFIPLAKVYGFEPVPPRLALDRQPHILGAQGNVWGEFLWTPQDVEYFAFPRAAALAEVVWSPPAARDFPDFQRRLSYHLRRLDALGVNFRRERPPP